MKYLSRTIRRTILEAAQSFPSLVLTGPRRAGKTTLLRHLFPAARYILLEDPDLRERVRSDPRGLLDELSPPVVFDEIQNTPELLPYIRTRIDEHPRKMGQWLFTGSQEAPLMRGITESMAGRAAILHLLPFSSSETARSNLLIGGYPEVVARPANRALWFGSYMQTYLERDVRAVADIRDLSTFRRFLGLVASRHGQLLNRTDLAAPLGLSIPSIGHWLEILEITGQIIFVPPYFENFGKRIVKSPKVYIADSGLACYLLGISSAAELARSPFLGALFEGYVASEIVKSQVNHGQRKEIYHFRDQQGLEVDFLFPHRGSMWMIECKAIKTVRPAMAAPLARLKKTIGEKPARMSVIYRAGRTQPDTRALLPGIEALDDQTFIGQLNSAPQPTKLRRKRL